MFNAYRCVSAVVIESCTFEDWSGKAIQAYESGAVKIVGCRFGAGGNEAVHGVRSAVLVENCVFERRYGYSDAIDVSDNIRPDPVPIIRGNIFLGSEDDGIDLDRCDAYVEGNLVMNCRGGTHDPIGISGDQDSRPILVNNVVVNCETGIGRSGYAAGIVKPR